MNIDTLSIGCIGCGNMGSAILFGLSKNKSLNIIGYDPNITSLAPLQSARIETAQDIEHLIINCNIIIIAVKPHLVQTILTDIAPLLTSDKIIISVAAGVSIHKLQSSVQNKCAVVRCMPNTPATVGAGVFAFCFDDSRISSKNKEQILALFAPIGMCLELAEKNFIAFSAFMGAGPAYVFHLMNALVQSGVTLGFSREESRQMVEKLFDGVVRMAKSSSQSLAVLRDNVCSPAGLTITGINHLERTAVSGHIIDAVIKAEQRSKEMEQNQ